MRLNALRNPGFDMPRKLNWVFCKDHPAFQELL